MKTTPWILCCILLASCSIFRKSFNKEKKEVIKSNLLLKDSSGTLTVEEVRKIDLSQWGSITVDSGYDNVTYEVIKDYRDSVFTVRTIKEKGQKRIEQVSHTAKYDSAASMITEHSQLQELEVEDSAAVVVTVQKDIKRSSFMPWWIWLIVAAPVVVIAVYNRRSILKFLGA